MYADLREWIEQVEAIGSLKRVPEEVHWDEEMAALTYMVHRDVDAPALLFERVTDSMPGSRVLFNMLSTSTERVALTMNEDPSATKRELVELARTRFNDEIEPEYVDDGPVFENTVTGDDVDLLAFPTPKMWPGDGGRYIGTATIAINRDPDTGIVNAGTYRQMIQSENRTGMYTSPGRDLRLHMKRQWEKGEPLEVAAVYGLEPQIYIAGGLTYGENVDEFRAAGGICGAPIQLVEGPVTGLPVPENAEIVVEGKIHPDDMMQEGPFGEFTGYYGRQQQATPVMTVEAVHYRDDPIMTCALMADAPASDNVLVQSIGRAARTLNDFDRLGVPGIEGVEVIRSGGTAMTIVSIDKQYAGHASQVVSLAGQMPGNAYFSKLIVVVDEDIDPMDMNQVMWALATRFNPEDDIDVLTDTWSSQLDPSQNPPEVRSYASKALIDATKHRDYDEYTERTAIREGVYRDLAERWAELGFEGSPPDLPAFAEEASGVITGAGTDENDRPAPGSADM